MHKDEQPANSTFPPAISDARWLLDIVAGRPTDPTRSVSETDLELAVRHGLIGILTDSSDEQVRQAALPLFARLKARQEVMESHLARFLSSLHESDIPATVLKGPHLAQWAYRNPDHRTFTDIDLLVPTRHIDAALRVLADDPAVYSIPPKTPKADKRNIPISDSSGVSFNLDLHWDLFSYTQLQGCADGATGWAWENARLIPDHPLGPLWELPEEARIAFLGTHAVLDHRFRMILFRDLAEVAEMGLDWGTVRDFAERWQLRSTTYLSLLIAKRATDAAIDDGFLQSLRPRSVPLTAAERLLAVTDLVNFDGHRVHPLNLAMVLLHDDWMTSLRLLAGAPVSFPSWRRRVGITPAGARRKTGSRAVRAESTLMLLVSGNRRRGAEVFGERLAAGLRNRGWRVELVAITGEEEGPWIPTDAVLSDHGYASGRFDPALVWQLRSRVKVLKPDVVVANGGSTLRYGAAALAGIVDAPELVYISIGEPTYWLRGRRHIALQRFLHRRADRTIAVSEMTRRQLVEHLGVDPDRVIVAHTGVPDEFFDTEPIPRSDEIRLLFMGNLSKEKAPDVALDVVDRLKDLTPARLRFVGGGPMMERLRRLATELDIEERVEFAGSVDNVRPHLAWADALLLTSLTEGFPGAVLEAGAAGVPSAAFSVGGTAETIIDGQTGLLFPPGDIDGLVLGLERLATDRAWCARLGEAARELVASRFRLEHSVDRFDDILRSRISMTAS